MTIEQSEELWKLKESYPVISLTFSDVKEMDGKKVLIGDEMVNQKRKDNKEKTCYRFNIYERNTGQAIWYRRHWMMLA